MAVGCGGVTVRFLLLLLTAAATTNITLAQLNLTVVGTTQVSGFIFPVNPFGAECNIRLRGTKECLGGCDARLAFFEYIRQQFPNSSLFLDAGSHYWGSLAFTGEAFPAKKGSSWFFL